MNAILNAFFPILSIIFVGFFLTKLNVLSSNTEKVLLELTFNLAIPALIFMAVLSEPIEFIENIKFIFGYFLSIFVVLSITFCSFKIFMKRNFDESLMIGISSSMSSSTLVPLPILMALFGIKALLPISIMSLTSTMFLLPCFIMVFEINQAKHSNLLRTLFRSSFKTFTNPMIMSFIIATIFKFFNVKFDEGSAFLIPLKYLSDIAMPSILLALGIMLARASLKNVMSFEILFISFITVIVKSIVALIISISLGLETMWAISLIIVSGSPTSGVMLALSHKYSICTDKITAVMISTTILSLIITPLIVYICQNINI